MSDTEQVTNTASTTEGETPEAKQFDFWVGEWDLTWEGGQGTNVIQPILDGRVIEENFSDPTSKFYGKSVSAFNKNTGKWQQTWVDNNGTYLDFIGGMNGDKMILSREFTNPEGKSVQQRMVWSNIDEKNFDWNWERSLDEGQTWELLWKIRYVRKQ